MKIITAATSSTASLLLAVVGKSSSAQDLAASASSSAVSRSPEGGAGQRSPLSLQDWTSQLSCTGDFTSQQPSINDRPTCDATAGCVWCDGVKGYLGQGLCASDSQKQTLGQFWDQLCGAAQSSPVPP